MHTLTFDSDLLLPKKPKINHELLTQTIDFCMQFLKTYKWSGLQVPCIRALR